MADKKAKKVNKNAKYVSKDIIEGKNITKLPDDSNIRERIN